jgi:hypothetical protein
MKRISSIILCLLLISSLISCNTQQDQAKHTTTTNTSEAESTPKEDLFLISTSESGSQLAEQSSAFKSAITHGIGSSSHTVAIDSLKNKTKNPFSDGTEFTYKQSEVKYKSAGSTEIGSFYSQYDVYTTQNKRVEYLTDSNLITYYSDSNSKANGQQQCTDETLLKSANDFLKKCIPESELLQYTCSETTFTVAGMTGIEFTRYIEGYKTDDILIVYFGDDGSIKSYNGSEACKFNSVSTKITKEKLDTATAKLMEKIEALELANLTHGDPVLTTNTSGEVFIEIWIRYTDAQNTNQDSYLDLLYVRVN